MLTNAAAPTMEPDPVTHYAKSGDVHIAYQIIGQGPIDLVLVPGWVSNIECFWEYPPCASFLRSLASFTRLIIFDKRGTGLSDRTIHMPTLETRMDDLRAVLAAADSPRAVLCGYSEGGPMCALFAATFPARTAGLIMLGAYAARAWRSDAPWGRTSQEMEQINRLCEAEWGAPLIIDRVMPSVCNDETARHWWGRYLRMSASPAGVVALNSMNFEIDVRPVLASVQSPVLVMHAQGDRMVDVRFGRELATLIPGARYVEMAGDDHVPWLTHAPLILREIAAFIATIGEQREPDRVLATVLFSDIVHSTERAIELGDRAWRELLGRHHQLVRLALQRHKGREVDTAGDGFFATFDGPARAIRCGVAIVEGLQSIGVEARIGVHTGECETLGGKVAGIAVHIGARVAAAAAPGEVLVSSTVKDLVAGSGLLFKDRGACLLKGLPDKWQLYAVGVDSAR